MYERGDTVWLRIGSPQMQVTLAWWVRWKQIVRVHWQADGKPREGEFQAKELVPYDPRTEDGA